MRGQITTADPLAVLPPKTSSSRGRIFSVTAGPDQWQLEFAWTDGQPDREVPVVREAAARGRADGVGFDHDVGGNVVSRQLSVRRRGRPRVVKFGYTLMTEQSAAK